jgi:hypothetical protein
MDTAEEILAVYSSKRLSDAQRSERLRRAIDEVVHGKYEGRLRTLRKPLTSTK